MNKTLVLNTSNEYAKYCGTTLTSLFETNASINFDVYIFSNYLSDDNRVCLQGLQDKYPGNGIKIQIIDGSLLDNLPVMFSYHSVACYLRVLAVNFLPPDVKKFLYMDCDIIINGDISSIFDIDISDCAVAATKDLPRFTPTYMKNLNIPMGGVYFNSGVMLVNTKYWRENHTAEKVIDYAEKNADKIIACDQDSMNALLQGKIKIIGREWNVYPDVFFERPELYEEEMGDVENIRKNPKVIHFLYRKAWDDHCTHPYRYLFDRYYALYTGKKFKRNFGLENIKTEIKLFLKYNLYLLGLKKIDYVYDRKYNRGHKRLI